MPSVCKLREHFTEQLLTIAADPDLSNPTRPRLERPLDTIRSFEAAIDGTYASTNNASVSRPSSLVRSRKYTSFRVTLDNR